MASRGSGVVRIRQLVVVRVFGNERSVRWREARIIGAERIGRFGDRRGRLSDWIQLLKREEN